ncbi:unnamed protein product [Ixodes hexagonus]
MLRRTSWCLARRRKARAYKYGAISKLCIGEREFEANAYRAAPENTSKGLVRGISMDEKPEDIVRSLVTPRNPGVLHAKRMGNTDNVIVLFDGFYVPRYVYYEAMLVRCTLYRKQIDVCHECGRLGHRADVCPNPKNKICRGCGCSNPSPEHRCEPKCHLCGKGHLAGDRKCRAKYKIPYLVKRRQWARRLREEEAAAAEDYVYNRGYSSSRNSKGGRLLLRLRRPPPGQRQGRALDEPRSERWQEKVPLEISRPLWCAISHRLPDLETEKQVDDARCSRTRRHRPRQPG